MTTLVTGAAGFAGQHLLDRLPTSADVHGWWRPGTPPPPRRPNVTWHALELTDRDAVRAAVVAIRPTHVYHLAGAPSVETSFVNAVPHLHINVMGTCYLLDAIRSLGSACRTLVVTSAQVYGASDSALDESAPLLPQSPYGVTKLAQDQLAAHAVASDGLDVCIARPFNHIGPRQSAGFAVARFARQIARIEHGLEPPRLEVGNLDAKRDMTDARDVVDAYRRIMDAGVAGRPYNVCSGRAHRIGDLLDSLRALALVRIDVVLDPARLRPVDVPIVVGDAGRLRAELQWVPRIAIGDTLRETLDWWRDEVRAGRDTAGG